MVVTKKRFIITVAIAYILDVGLSAGMQYVRWHTVGFLLLMSWLMGDITFKEKGDTK